MSGLGFESLMPVVGATGVSISKGLDAHLPRRLVGEQGHQLLGQPPEGRAVRALVPQAGRLWAISGWSATWTRMRETYRVSPVAVPPDDPYAVWLGHALAAASHGWSGDVPIGAVASPPRGEVIGTGWERA